MDILKELRTGKYKHSKIHVDEVTSAFFIFLPFAILKKYGEEREGGERDGEEGEKSKHEEARKFSVILLLEWMEKNLYALVFFRKRQSLFCFYSFPLFCKQSSRKLENPRVQVEKTSNINCMVKIRTHALYKQSQATTVIMWMTMMRCRP